MTPHPARAVAKLDPLHLRFSDGSTRRRFPKLRGKAAVKAAKRERQAIRRTKVRSAA